ncbi:AEC family transporter [Kaustia mangrovi]|uniref:AEC family transporter n=1 Tax=Kaustia mangrovi TaxID=2593653 RepID=A0A7S8C6F6_9HYPH|nr:AEC family transporter [Kaustia mangrovi]QPC44261.1 AEC family transporter [Kaustia mangrovi]
MEQVINTVIPVFGLIALGYLASRSGLIAQSVTGGLTAFVFTIATPALLFRTMAAVEVPAVSPWALWAAYFGGVAVAWLMGWGLVRHALGGSPLAAAGAGVASAYSNTVLLGLPLIFAVIGDRGALPLFLILSIHLPIMAFAATLQMELASQSGGLRARLVVNVLSGLVKNPIVIGLAAGVLWRLTGLSLPTAAQTLVDMLADAAVPTALFAMGLGLAGYGVRAAGRAALAITAVKLVVHPLVVWVLAAEVFALPPVWTAVAVVFAAAPTGINSFVFSTQYRAGAAAVSGAIALGTALSIVTVSLALWATATP